MIHHKIDIKVSGSMPGTQLVTYIQDFSEQLMINKRPIVILCPGGAYKDTSDREAESMAIQFLAMGYHAAVLRYSTAPARFPTALMELAHTVRLVREHAEEWHIDENKIIVQGCSAGGHLAASLGVFWNEAFVTEGIGLKSSECEKIRPDGMILCYPVITTGEFAHRFSCENLIGNKSELLDQVSLEKRVTAKVPKTFIWHTYEDESVLVENSLLFVSALRRAGVSTEFHMYPRGKHGLAIANHLTANAKGDCVQEECSSWMKLAHTWLEQL